MYEFYKKQATMYKTNKKANHQVCALPLGIF